MKKFLTDIHTHSKYSFDGQSELAEMLAVAHGKGIDFYGVSEHFDYDLLCLPVLPRGLTDAEAYFHGARRLQGDYEGAMNVLVGAEFSYADDEKAHRAYEETYKKYRPDFIVNSVHTLHGEDYYDGGCYYTTGGNGDRVLRDKREVYEEYLGLVERSLLVSYPYDIVGHIGYVTRYAPYADASMPYEEYAARFDVILKTIVGKNKILEANTSVRDKTFLPTVDIFRRYFELGGRNVSLASDAHGVDRIAEKREEAVRKLKAIGFTHVTVPCKGEYIKLEM
ncbi:MAG: histidinol-phosphatase HisJ family protein [Clostridia bacterium]|nr:histidinol-phosphatase HisJ family protein [Clostridia bacterium]